MTIEPPEGLPVQACLRVLSDVLWRERVSLDRLADSLLAGDPDVDAEPTYQSISALELDRAISAQKAAAELGLDGEPTLRRLTKAAPPGWGDVFASHLRALVDLTNEVTHLARRPFIDLSDRQHRHRTADSAGRAEPRDRDTIAEAFGVSGVRRFGVQRSLREFLS